MVMTWWPNISGRIMPPRWSTRSSVLQMLPSAHFDTRLQRLATRPSSCGRSSGQSPVRLCECLPLIKAIVSKVRKELLDAVRCFMGNVTRMNCRVLFDVWAARILGSGALGPTDTMLSSILLLHEHPLSPSWPLMWLSE
jgi:hypothetical protein